VENIYIEPLELSGRPPAPADPGGTERPVGDPPNGATSGEQIGIPQVFNLISPAQHIALEMSTPPLSGRAKKQSEFVRTGARNESFKL
jgi:hypothetical protein